MPIVKTVQPTTLTLVITRRCSAQCRNCCSQCSPYKQQEIPLDDAIGYIDKALNAFPSIKVLVITGGECMLNVEKLNEIISYGNKYGLVVRIVTNCFWATSQEKADRLVEALVKNGLQEINFSTGDEHQEFVPLENIVYAVIASLEHNLTCGVNAIFNEVDIDELNREFEFAFRKNASNSPQRVAVKIDIEDKFILFATTLSSEIIENPETAKFFITNQQEYLKSRGFSSIKLDTIADKSFVDLIVAFSDEEVNEAINNNEVELYVKRLRELNVLDETILKNAHIQNLQRQLLDSQDFISMLKEYDIQPGNDALFAFALVAIVAAVVYLGAIVSTGAALNTATFINLVAVANKGIVYDTTQRINGNDVVSPAKPISAQTLWYIKGGDPMMSTKILNLQLEDSIDKFIEEVERAFPGSMTPQNMRLLRSFILAYS